MLVISACHIETALNDKVYDLRGKIINLARSLKGIRYSFGGSDIYGFDCSGFVNYVYDSFGIKIPRTAKKQGKAGKRIKLKKAKSADIIVFKIKRSWHSGILVKIDKKTFHFIHSPNKRGVVREEKLSDYWLDRIKYIVKVLK